MAKNKKPAKLAIRPKGAEVDPSADYRFRVTTPSGDPIYLASEGGLTLTEAVRLARGLVQDASVAQIVGDQLYAGSVDLSNPSEPIFTSVEPIPEVQEEVAA
jgi:hypothetical protein